MNQKIKISQGIQYVILFLAVVLFLAIWPLGIIQKTQVSKSDEVQLRESGPICVESNGTQMFIAEGSFLKAVDLYVLNDMGSQTITFRVYDGAYTQLWETFHVVDEKAEFPGFVHIPIEMEMEEGWEYYYTVEGLTQPMFLAYEDTNASTSYANGTYLYGGVEQPGINIIIRYTYTEPFSWWMTLIFGAVIFLAAKGLLLAVDKVFSGKWREKNRLITLQRLLQWTLNPLVIAATMTALLMVFPGRIFGVGIINYGFYYLGVLLLAMVLLVAINYRRLGQESFSLIQTVKEKAPFWGMSLCFAGVLWSCYEYMNGLYDIHHSYAACKLLTWMGLALLFTFKKENIFKVWNLIYVAGAAIGAYFYAKPYVGIEEQEELYRLQARVMVVAGFLLLQIILSVIQRLRKKALPAPEINYGYAALFLVWSALMIWFSNTRDWVVVLVVVAVSFYYCMWNWEKRRMLLSVFSNGIIFNFLYTVGYCLLHRPYLRFRHNRYGMVYHTVTMTGYYLALVLCAVVVRLVIQYRKTRRMVDCWKELSLLGTGNVYLFLTLSRTGYLAAFVMQLFIVLFCCIVMERQKLKSIVLSLAVMTGVSVLFFPIVFTAQRILPAMANDPVYSEIEVWEYVVEKGEPKNSELYIDIVAFIKVAGNKLFGIDMGNISLSYGGEEPKSKLQLSHEPVKESGRFWKDWQNMTKPVYVRDDSYQLASEAQMYEEEDISNGRFEIFTEYIGHWNLTGHELMGVPLKDGTMAVHAHNTYLQMIHDHGLVTGIVFILFGMVSFVLAVIRYVKEKEKSAYLALTIAVIIAFGVAGMVEWIFHLCNPFGIALIVVITPLFFKKAG